MPGYDWLQFKAMRQKKIEELEHSAKGTTWKNHKYTQIITTSSGKKRYVYKDSSKHTVSDKKPTSEGTTIVDVLKKVDETDEPWEKRSMLIEAVNKNRADILKLQREATELKRQLTRTYNKTDKKAVEDEIKKKEAQIDVKEKEIEKYQEHKYWHGNTRSKHPAEGSNHR